MALFAAVASSCSGQETKKGNLAQNESENHIKEPKGNWTVNKEVDENGNLVRYDSIYSYSSGNIPEGFMPKSTDSLMNSFTQKFEKHFFSSSDGTMPDLFEEGSPFEDDIFKDFFEEDSGNAAKMMKKMQESMQAFHSQMQQETPLIPAEPDKKKEKDSGTL